MGENFFVILYIYKTQLIWQLLIKHQCKGHIFFSLELAYIFVFTIYRAEIFFFSSYVDDTLFLGPAHLPGG